MLVTFGLLAVLLAACDSETDDSDASPASSSSSPASTTTTETPGEARGSGGECPAAPDGTEPAPSAVAADLDGDGELDAAWIEEGSEGRGPVLMATLASGATSETALDDDPAVEPEVVSVVDIGEDRDSLLVRVGTGAYTVLVGVFGFADCEVQPIVDPESLESEPFVVAEGASVMNGSYYACFTHDGETALVTGSWTTNEAGEKDWSEGLVRREGLEIVQAGEAVTGVAETEEGIGTDRGEECPEPTDA